MRPCRKSAFYVIVLTVISLQFAGCHNSAPGDNAAAAALAPRPDPVEPAPDPVEPAPDSVDAVPDTPSEPATHGYFIGGVYAERPDGLYGWYAEAMLTEDGFARLFVWGAPPSAAGWFVSPQFAGNLEFTDGQGYGDGLLYSHACDPGIASTECGTTMPAEVVITTATRDELFGEVSLADGTTWTLQLFWPSSTYLEPATYELAAGLWSEYLMEFGVVSIDDGGRLFFQSPAGCVGNGSLVPHADGAFNVYDAELLVENCASYNGLFEGLASRSIVDGSWDALMLWLTTVESEPEPLSLVLWTEKF